jgi:acyl-CoA reductase-like NAD-dependent aldehyde dehydrogenase
MADSALTLIPRQHIGGRWRESAHTWTLANPADTRQSLAEVPVGTEEDVIEAVETAAGAAGQWAQTSLVERSEIISRAADLLHERREEMAHAITLEMGKPLAESRGEATRTVDYTRYFATTSRQPIGYTADVGTSDQLGYTVRDPLGVIGAVCPWNFPALIPNWKIASALVFGNTVVFKPAEIAPLSATLLTEVYLEAGVPPEALNLVLASGSKVGPVLSSHPAVAGITFTGSTEVGQRLAAAATANGKRTQCEMGGKNALIVMPDADLEAATAAIVLGGFGTTGQRCTASSRVLAHRDIIDGLQERVETAMDSLVVGSGLDEATTVGPMASQSQFKTTYETLQTAIDEGAAVVRGGGLLSEGAYAHGWFMEPTLLRADNEGTAFYKEIFGPVVSLHEFGTLEEAIALNNAVRYGLSSAIYTRDLAAAHRFIHGSDTGMVHVNRPTVGAEAHLPFGGTKASALGTAELGAAAQFYTKTRAVYLHWDSQS